MRKLLYIAFYLLPLPVFCIALAIGPSADINASSIILFIKSKFAPTNDSTAELATAILFNVRLPRILLAFLVGAALSASGQTMQAMFRNPLVEPYILGISSGAAFGAAFAMATGILPVQMSAFMCGLFSAALSYLLAKSGKQLSIVSLLLSGIIVSGIFTALLAVVQFFSDPFRLQTIVHWTMGNLHNASWDKVYSAIIPIAFGLGWLLVFRWRVNVLSLGDDEAHAVGMHPVRERMFLLIPATLVATSSVSVAGIIPMIGLITPHIIRMLFGADNSKTIVLSILLGGLFIVVVDTISRSLMPFELPIGIFTMAIGGPIFFYIMKKFRFGMIT